MAEVPWCYERGALGKREGCEALQAAEARTAEVLLQAEEVERERNYLESACRIIRGPYDFQGDDFGPARARREAGGGYEGLQAIAGWGLAQVERLRGEAEPTVHHSTTLVQRRTEDPCVGCGRPIDGGQAYVSDGPRHLGCRS